MGEYARYNGQEVKIGTCEDMYYLRYDQRRKVHHISGNVHPVNDAGALRFRFPWPDEDLIEPGSGKFHDKGYHRSIAIHGFTAPEVEHYTVQFTASAGYLTSLPCPEGDAYVGDSPRVHKDDASIKIHRNGFGGSVQLVAQRFIPEIGLVPILRCGGCSTMWREIERARIEEIAVCLRSEGDRRELEDSRGPNGHPGGGLFWHQIADRVLAGITETAAP